jgi:hypothetical protein
MSITEKVIGIFSGAFGSGDGRGPEAVLEKGLEASMHKDVVLKEENLIDDSHRWFNQYEFIYYIPSEDRWVLVDAGIGKTEYQENEIWDAREVRPQEKVITTIEYINV